MVKQLALLTSLALLAGCVHTTPLPVQTSQPGDTMMSCQSIVNEMQNMKNTVREKDHDLNGQIAKNSALGVGGIFLLGVPWLFMDTSDANTVESQAAKARFDKLKELYADKNCATGGKAPDTK
ncbi:TPA: hypothetical protein ACIVLM_000341 [Salmonella enterica subsp. enterica serovar Birkenhead]